MKKFFVILFCTFVFLSVTAYAYNTPDLNFIHDNGKYIYCNNPENIRRTDLADSTNYNAKYIMNNSGLTADKYAIFLSHYNHTFIMNESGTAMTDPGFDIEVDVQFKAVEDTTVTISSLGFEVTGKKQYWLHGKKYTDDSPLGCMTAWASYLKMPISQIDSGEYYEPIPFEPVTFSVKKGETVWLSEYIPNYSAIEVNRVIHLMADFEITSGVCDVNVAALKSNGILGSRKNFNHNALFASHFNERQYKGIADSANSVTSSIYYYVDYYVYHGMKLPIRVYNSKYPYGNVTNTWHTHLNPSSDFLDASGADESNMLAFTYRDDSKLKYYGRNIKESEKENVWYFDTKHNDVVEYKEGYGKKAYFRPNTNDRYEAGYSHCNLGNYGVLENYNFAVENATSSMRYLSYKLRTGSNNIVILYDENGKVMPGYPLCKGYTESPEEDTMACIPLPPGELTKFKLTVILPTNYYGDMAHSLVVNTEPEPVQTYNTQKQYISSPYSHTGREFYKWENTKLYFSDDAQSWHEVEISKQVKDIVWGKWKNYVLHYVGDGYVLRADNMGGIYFYYPQKFYQEIYFLDEKMNITSTHKFNDYPSDFTYAKGVYYANTSPVVTSTDRKEWKVFASGQTMPVYNGGRFVAAFKDRGVTLSSDGIEFMPVVYENAAPEFIESYAQLYYWIKNNTIYFSHDGVYWSYALCPEPISSVYALGTNLIINGDRIVSCGTNPQTPVVVVGGTVAGYAQPPYIENGTLMVPEALTAQLLGINDGQILSQNSFVPLREYAESKGCEVRWDDDTKTAYVD